MAGHSADRCLTVAALSPISAHPGEARVCPGFVIDDAPIRGALSEGGAAGPRNARKRGPQGAETRKE
jgi:hypothetical protein